MRLRWEGKNSIILIEYRLSGFDAGISSLFGVVPPFCSCSSVPLFIGFVRGGIPFVVVGIAIGGWMHGYIPEGFFAKHMAADNLFAVPVATILAIPMYSNASGVLPVVQVLVEKGIPLGTAIAFMMGVVGLSLPEAMLLKKVMTFKLIAIFFGVVAICIIASGYLFNLLL